MSDEKRPGDRDDLIGKAEDAAAGAEEQAAEATTRATESVKQAAATAETAARDMGYLADEIGEATRERERHARTSISAWARAIVGGIRDTGVAMKASARHEAQQARAEGWERYEELTKRRREK